MDPFGSIYIFFMCPYETIKPRASVRKDRDDTIRSIGKGKETVPIGVSTIVQLG